jgi:hypothetical protein
VGRLAGDVVQKLNRLKADIKSSVDHLETIRRRLHTLAVIERERYYQELLSDKKYSDRTRLEPYGFKVYSQYEEDGIIQEIFHRIGLNNKTFIEFGVETGLENNTLKLLLEGWSGLWIEGNNDYVTAIRTKFSNVLQSGKLRLEKAFVDRENLNELICPYYKNEIDLISIDIDGNDIYILENLEVVNPRVIVIEYNGKFPPPMSVAQKYNAGHRWRGTDYGGASLSAITKVANRKGYSLVGCTLAGVNAFLVRNDLVTDCFCKPFTPENHYQPARYFLWQTFVSGHPPDWGEYVTL